MLNCIQTAGSTADCDIPCTAGIDALADGCEDDIYCEVAGEVDAPVNPQVPAFKIRYGLCIPLDCNDDYHDSVQDYLRYQVCGPNFYGGADCNAIQLGCVYPMTAGTMWAIIGGVAGGVALVVVACFGFCWWRRKRLISQGLIDDDDDDDGVGEPAYGDDDPYAVPGGPSAYVAVDAAGVPLGIVATGGIPVGSVATAQPARSGGGGGYTYAVRTAPATASAGSATVPLHAAATERDTSALLLDSHIAAALAPPVTPTRAALRTGTQDAIMSADSERL